MKPQKTNTKAGAKALAIIPAGKPLDSQVAPVAVATVGNAKRVSDSVAFDKEGEARVANATLACALTKDDVREYIAETSVQAGGVLERAARTLYALRGHITGETLRDAFKAAVNAGANKDTIKKLPAMVLRALPLADAMREASGIMPSLSDAHALASALEPVGVPEEDRLKDGEKRKLLKAASANLGGKLRDWIESKRAAGDIPTPLRGSASHAPIPQLEPGKPGAESAEAAMRGSAYLVPIAGSEPLPCIVSGGKLILRDADGKWAVIVAPLEAAETLPVLEKAIGDALAVRARRKTDKADKASESAKPLHEATTEKPLSPQPLNRMQSKK